MELQLIRNATMRLVYAGHTLLTDPCLAPRHAIQSFGGREKNPIVDLPLPVAEIVAGAELVLVSHLHGDHWDAVAADVLPNDIPLLCQPGDEARLAADGFRKVQPLADVVRLARDRDTAHAGQAWERGHGGTDGRRLRLRAARRR